MLKSEGISIGTSDRAKSILSRIEWDFSSPFSVGRSGATLFDMRKHHWYPATFIPEIPFTLIEVLSKPGDTVYDPFGGIGTTVFQALSLGRRPVATENGSVPVKLVRAALTAISEGTAGVEDFCQGIAEDYDPKLSYVGKAREAGIRTSELAPWFNRQTFNELCFLIARQRALRRKGLKAAALITLSATLKAVCAQDRGWGCIADNMLPKPEQVGKRRDALARFVRSLTVLSRDVEAFRDSAKLHGELKTRSPDSIFIQRDVRTSGIPEASCDLVVTSPPYPEMTDYSTAQRLSYYLLGGAPDDDLPTEIGARRRRFRGSSLAEYRSEMRDALAEIARTVRPGGYACFVMPFFDVDRHNNRERRELVESTMATFEPHGFGLETKLERILPDQRRHHNQVWTALEREHIYVYRRRA